MPAATVTLVATLLLAKATLGSNLDPNLAGDVRWASLFAGNFRLISTGSNYFVAGISPSLITQFWSLAVEEQFYLVFPLVVFLIGHFIAPDRRIRVLSITLSGGIFLSAWWSVHISASEPTVAYYSPFTRFWELGLGCLLATRMTGRLIRTRRAERLVVVVAVGLLLVSLVELNSHSIYPGRAAWLPCSCAALLIWAGARGVRNPVTRLLSSKRLGYVGDRSYSLYLTHYLWLKLPAQLTPPLTGAGWRLLELIATVATALGCYRFVENPLRRSRRLAADPVATVLLLLVCVAASWTTAELVDHLTHRG